MDAKWRVVRSSLQVRGLPRPSPPLVPRRTRIAGMNQTASLSGSDPSRMEWPPLTRMNHLPRVCAFMAAFRSSARLMANPSAAALYAFVQPTATISLDQPMQTGTPNGSNAMPPNRSLLISRNRPSAQSDNQTDCMRYLSTNSCATAIGGDRLSQGRREVHREARDL